MSAKRVRCKETGSGRERSDGEAAKSLDLYIVGNAYPAQCLIDAEREALQVKKMKLGLRRQLLIITVWLQLDA